MNASLPPVVEFDMVIRDRLDYMVRLSDIAAEVGYPFPEELLDKLDLPEAVRVRCSLDTATGEVTIVAASRA